MRELGRTGYDPAVVSGERSHATAWIPTADIFAEGIDLIVQMELAGVEPESVDVALSGGVLTISGIRAGRTDVDDENFYAKERFHGAFRRVISLPASVREEDVEATFGNGLLEIVIRGACSAVPEPRRIRVKQNPG